MGYPGFEPGLRASKARVITKLDQYPNMEGGNRTHISRTTTARINHYTTTISEMQDLNLRPRSPFLCAAPSY